MRLRVDGGSVLADGGVARYTSDCAWDVSDGIGGVTMKTYGMILMVGVACLGALSCVAADGEKTATLLQAVTLVDAATTPLPRVVTGDHLACLGLANRGYYVGLLDEAGEPRYGLLPFHDTWGRVVARDWRHHLDLPARVVEVLLPQALLPVRVVVSAGLEADVVGETEDTLSLAWRCSDFVLPLTVSRDAALLAEPEALPARERVVAGLEASVGEEQERKKQLTAEVSSLDAYISRTRSLMDELTTLALNNAELEGQRTVSRKVASVLAEGVPRAAEQRETHARELQKAVKQQSNPARQEAKLAQERALLDSARRHLLDARVELGELKLAAATEKAELDALKAAATSDPNVERVLRDASSLNQRLVRGVAKDNANAEAAESLLGLLDSLQQANSDLLEELRASRTQNRERGVELSEMSAQIQQLQAALNPRAPRTPTGVKKPAPTPAGPATATPAPAKPAPAKPAPAKPAPAKPAGPASAKPAPAKPAPAPAPEK